MTSSTKQELVAAATSACLALKETKAQNASAKDAAFRASAIATGDALRGRVDAKALAESNKAAGAGYGSPSAVKYHAVTGWLLSLPEDEDGESLPSAESIQTIVKKVFAVDAPLAQSIIKKSKTQQAAVEGLKAAVQPVTVADLLEQARRKVDAALESRVSGGEWTDEAREQAESIFASIETLLATSVLASTPASV